MVELAYQSEQNKVPELESDFLIQVNYSFLSQESLFLTQLSVSESVKVTLVTKLTKLPLETLPEREVLVLHRADLVDDDLSEDVLGDVLRVEDAHEAVAQLLLHLHRNVRLEALAQRLVLVLEVTKG